ncbi:hypothetical protein SK128_020819, partial [Halocaridina rubra]
MRSPEKEEKRPCKLTNFKKMSSTPALDVLEDEDHLKDLQETSGEESVHEIPPKEPRRDDEVHLQNKNEDVTHKASSALEKENKTWNKCSECTISPIILIKENVESVRPLEDLVRCRKGSLDVGSDNTLETKKGEGTRDDSSHYGCGHFSVVTRNEDSADLSAEKPYIVPLGVHHELDLPCACLGSGDESESECEHLIQCQVTKDSDRGASGPTFLERTPVEARKEDIHSNNSSVLSTNSVCQFDNTENSKFSDVENHINTSTTSATTPVLISAVPSVTDSSVVSKLTDTVLDSSASSNFSPLDLSDILRISKDILSHSPCKTLTLLQ